MDYRHKDNYSIAKLPTLFTEEKRAKCTPCSTCNQLVLADLSSTDSYKNDLKGVFLKRDNIGDLIIFTIEKDGVVLTNLGTDGIFPESPLTVGFMYDWKQYLSTYGIGCYVIRCEFTIAGIEGSYTIGIYDLLPYSVTNASRTVRVYSKFSSYSLSNELDFTNSNFEDMLRFNGFFGNRTPETQINNLIDKGRKVEKVTRENLNKYELRTDPLNECKTKQLLDFHFLHEDEIYISDHNRTNHSYNYFDKPLALVDTPSVDYIEGDRGAKITALFGDKILNRKSYYNKK
tara:strand:+ start:1553 stop:2416 length:864 start_codon:yes stop_codon:yes gene_type:complete